MEVKNVLFWLIKFFSFAEVAQTNDLYCATCMDPDFWRLEHHYNFWVIAIKVDQKLTKLPCSEGQFLVKKCSTSCLHMRINFEDPRKNMTRDVHMFGCGYGAVHRFPGTIDGQYYIPNDNTALSYIPRTDLRIYLDYYKSSRYSLAGFPVIKLLPSYTFGSFEMPKYQAHWSIFGIVIVFAIGLFLYVKSGRRSEKMMFANQNIDEEEGQENAETISLETVNTQLSNPV